MKKIIKSRKNVFALITLLAGIATGCSFEDELDYTEIKPIYTTAYDCMQVEKEEGYFEIEDLSDLDFYLITKEEENGTTVDTKILKYEEHGNYSVYIDALSGGIYSLNIYNPTKYDLIKYKDKLIKRDMYYLESLENEIEDCKNIPIIANGIDNDKNTISVQALRLLVASYYPHNYMYIDDMKVKVK